ncbi:hypothetical protein [Robbsia andropogonis]|uniref:hypothetical protein n=2 Tax=Robbsia andropogonis TaxID=28092 RepID=UPI00158B3DB1|nr:hypothetical protein [Robbsia andropogonis]
MNSKSPCYLVKSRDIRAAALYELADAVMHNRNIPGLSPETAYVLTHEQFPTLVEGLIDGPAIKVGIFLEPMYKEMRLIEQRLWREYAYACFVSNQCSFQLLQVFFPELTRYKHEQYLRENKTLVRSKIRATEAEEHSVYLGFRELVRNHPDKDFREIYMILAERYVHLSMTTIITIASKINIAEKCPG